MKVTLAIVTCGFELEVALEGPSIRGVSTARLAGSSRRSSLLLAAIDLLVEDAGLDPGDLERIVVSRGPGSFTGIRSALASASGLAMATGAEVVAYDSLLCQAARVVQPGEVWAAQPGRRGEVYAQRFTIAAEGPPVAADDVEIVAVCDAHERQAWVAPGSLDIGRAERVATARSAAEALLVLAASAVPAQPLEPLYVEGPPIRRSTKRE